MPYIHKEIKNIVKSKKLAEATLQFYILFFNLIKSVEQKTAFLIDIKDEITLLISNEIFQENSYCTDILRQYFDYYSNFNLFEEGLKFFLKFPEIIKSSKFNSIKAFLFYFAYQTKKFASPEVKELLNQELLSANLKERENYLDFSLYCFFRGLYYIERKNYFLGTYFYCAAVGVGLNDRDSLILNQFTIQMIRSLCFLRVLSDFDIKEFLFKRAFEQKCRKGDNFNYEDIDSCLNFLLKKEITLEIFYEFVKYHKDLYKDNKLIGLKNQAEYQVILEKIREITKIFKKIKLSKLTEYMKIDSGLLLKVIKRKCLEGELNMKYDEENEVLEIFDVDPGKKEKIKKMQELYKELIEANKNFFITIRDQKLEKLNNKGKESLGYDYMEGMDLDGMY